MEKSIIIAGFGGQGVLSAGLVLANSFMLDNKEVTWYPCYGAEMRGGTVNCEIVVGDEPISSVHKKEADYVIALNDLSFDKFLPRVKKGGYIIANSSLMEEKQPRNDINYVFAKITDTARRQGNIKSANIASLGILSTICETVNLDMVKQAINEMMANKPQLVEINLNTLTAGVNYNKQIG